MAGDGLWIGVLGPLEVTLDGGRNRRRQTARSIDPRRPECRSVLRRIEQVWQDLKQG